jgi:pyruvate dehydrogenase E2 component (dihydrolipoamide acetyltransferase)
VAKFLNLSKDVRFLTHGVLGVRAVKPGDVVEVADEVAQAYASQPGLWQPACEVAKAAAAAVDRAVFGALEGVVEKLKGEAGPVPAATPPATTPAAPVPAATPPATPAPVAAAPAAASDATSGETKQ